MAKKSNKPVQSTTDAERIDHGPVIIEEGTTVLQLIVFLFSFMFGDVLIYDILRGILKVFLTYPLVPMWIPYLLSLALGWWLAWKFQPQLEGMAKSFWGTKTSLKWLARVSGLKAAVITLALAMPIGIGLNLWGFYLGGILAILGGLCGCVVVYDLVKKQVRGREYIAGPAKTSKKSLKSGGETRDETLEDFDSGPAEKEKRGSWDDNELVK